MCFFLSLIPGTFFAIIGYFVLFSSTKAEGTTKKSGGSLAIWIFVIAALFPIIGLCATLSGRCPMGGIMQGMHSGMNP